MISKINALKMPEIRVAVLLAEGWHLIYDEGNNDVIAVQSHISEWKTLSWAMQTYYRAKYNFNEDGILEIRLKPGVSGWIGHSAPTASPEHIPLPSKAVPGSDQRLRAIFEESVVDVEPVGYDYSARLHYGTDGSAILVTDPSWGIPIPGDMDYIEPHHEYWCLWDGSTPHHWGGDAPWWAMTTVC